MRFFFVMRISSCIQGSKVMLVPYLKEHVEKYHEWMKSDLLREQTASEPLSLAEEYEMQETWCADPDKCTFIILDLECYRREADQVKAMVGDTNLFLNMEADSSAGEIEIMIAEAAARGKGFALEALKLMITYCQRNLNIKRFIAKIGDENHPSIHLFTEKLGFTEISRSEVFREITFERVYHQPEYYYPNRDFVEIPITTVMK